MRWLENVVRSDVIKKAAAAKLVVGVSMHIGESCTKKQHL
jgi:acyl-CoA reductase-like NAD-dependent aldehyde dehydrogenase